MYIGDKFETNSDIVLCILLETFEIGILFIHNVSNMNFGLAYKKYHLNKTLFHSYPYKHSLYEARKTHKIFEKSLNFDNAPIL